MKFTVVEEPSGGVKTRLVWGDGGGARGALQSCFALESRSRHHHRGAYPPPSALGACPLDHMYVNLH